MNLLISSLFSHFEFGTIASKRSQTLPRQESEDAPSPGRSECREGTGRLPAGQGSSLGAGLTQLPGYLC